MTLYTSKALALDTRLTVKTYSLTRLKRLNCVPLTFIFWWLLVIILDEPTVRAKNAPPNCCLKQDFCSTCRGGHSFDLKLASHSLIICPLTLAASAFNQEESCACKTLEVLNNEDAGCHKSKLSSQEAADCHKKFIILPYGSKSSIDSYNLNDNWLENCNICCDTFMSNLNSCDTAKKVQNTTVSNKTDNSTSVEEETISGNITKAPASLLIKQDDSHDLGFNYNINDDGREPQASALSVQYHFSQTNSGNTQNYHWNQIKFNDFYLMNSLGPHTVRAKQTCTEMQKANNFLMTSINNHITDQIKNTNIFLSIGQHTNGNNSPVQFFCDNLRRMDCNLRGSTNMYGRTPDVTCLKRSCVFNCEQIQRIQENNFIADSRKPRAEFTGPFFPVHNIPNNLMVCGSSMLYCPMSTSPEITFFPPMLQRDIRYP